MSVGYKNDPVFLLSKKEFEDNIEYIRQITNPSHPAWTRTKENSDYVWGIKPKTIYEEYVYLPNMWLEIVVGIKLNEDIQLQKDLIDFLDVGNRFNFYNDQGLRTIVAPDNLLLIHVCSQNGIMSNEQYMDGFQFDYGLNTDYETSDIRKRILDAFLSNFSNFFDSEEEEPSDFNVGNLKQYKGNKFWESYKNKTMKEEFYKLDDFRILNEDKRQQILAKSKSGANYKGDQSKGRNRFQRRIHSSLSSSTKEYNQVDMNLLFSKAGILQVNIPVKGETNDYLVRIRFGDFLTELKQQLKSTQGKLDLRIIMRSLINCYNTKDVYVGCSCPDFQYRFGSWCLVGDTSSISFDEWNKVNPGGPNPANRMPDITNPDDDLGACCKHVDLVLNVTSWLIKCASVVNNYIKFMKIKYPALYQNFIYPMIYDADFDPNNRLDEPDKREVPLNDTDEKQLDDYFNDIDDVTNKANDYAVTSNRFQKGNKEGIRFAPKAKEEEPPLEDEEDIVADVDNL